MHTSSSIRAIAASGLVAFALSGCSASGPQPMTTASGVNYSNFGPNQPSSGYSTGNTVITGGSTGTFGTTDQITVDDSGPFPDNSGTFDPSLSDLSSADQELLAGTGIDFDAERLAASNISFPANASGPAFFDAEIGSTIYFETDSSELGDLTRDTLRKQAAWLTVNSDVIATIEGHTDERGTREYNLALGERRASAVRGYLTALGVADDRVRKISYGKERPVAVGSDESAWSQNRRAETKLDRQALEGTNLSSITSDLSPPDPLLSAPQSGSLTIDQLLNDPVLNDIPGGDPLLNDPLLNDPLLNDPLLNDV